MSLTADDLFALLPAVHRTRDAELGGPLRGLLRALAGQAAVVDQDIARLYDDWFIETCQEWLVPYIGDLLRARGAYAVTPGTASRRGAVANTLGYRRRKGTLAVLERIAFDVTGWRARAVELFRLLATTQHVNHPRPAATATPDLRDTAALELLGGPFESAAHVAEVRRIAPGRGRYDLPNVGVFLWRLQDYPLTDATARPVASPPDGRLTFSPLGLDGPLFNAPRTETALDHLATEVDVPGVLRRRPLHDELEALRAGSTAPRAWFSPGAEALAVAVAPGPGQPAQPIPPERVFVCDLGGWRRPPAAAQLTVAVDPALGRIAFPAGQAPGEVRVSYAYGFGGDVGGGPYGRPPASETWLRRPVTWQMGVVQDQATRAAASDPGLLSPTLAGAIAAWNSHVAASPTAFGVIAVMDSRTYREDLTGAAAPLVPAGSGLAIVAAAWPEVPVPGWPGRFERVTGGFEPAPLRPHLLGGLEAAGAAAAGAPGGDLVLEGLLLEGGVTVLPGGLGSLTVAHCTLVPAAGGLVVAGAPSAGMGNAELTVSLVNSLCGPIDLAATVPALAATDSVLDAGGAPAAVRAPGADAALTACTVLGTASVRGLDAADCIFTGAVTAARLQAGCVRCSSVPAGSATPRRFRCQPDLALRGAAGPAEAARITARLTPSFTAVTYGDPGYAQLAANCAVEIAAGAGDGAEMGAFHFLRQPQRLKNLGSALDEHLRLGLEAGHFFVT